MPKKLLFNNVDEIPTIDPNAPAPSKVTNLVVVDKTSETVTISWDFLTDSSNLKSFNIYVGTLLFAEVSSDIRNHIVTGLSANVIYSIKVSSNGINGKNSTVTTVAVRTSAS